ncbi:MAG: site-2 protease family protein, partial [Planctomycetota bacterium]
MSWQTALFLFPGLIIGLTIHEFAHAITAKWLGDRYPEKMGRVSLNPLRHLSLWGTLALFILGFGWGKPVPINLYNFKRPKLYYLLTSIAGPV